jgi:hypothetical protein
MTVRPGLDIVMERKSMRESGEELSWSGTAAVYTAADAPPSVVPLGDATLVARGDKILGSIQVGTETYSVIPLSGGLHAVARVNQDAFPPEHPPQAATTPSPAGDAPLMNMLAVPRPTGPSEVMIGVAFTQAAADAIQANLHVTPDHLAAAVIDLTNVGYRDSRITSHLKLAGTQLITGAEIPGFDAMVAAVVKPNDGAFDAIHAWRQTVKADAVLVFVAMNEYCGMAADIHVPASKAFAIVNWDCALGNLSVPHEFGHLLGARHDPDTDPETRPFAYAHGFRYQALWRTVMAYAGGTCGSCPRINRWASPTLQFNGVPMGTPDRNDDARLVEEMLPVFSTYFGP